MKLLKRFLFTVALTVFFSSHITGQTINPNWLDGKIYFKLANHVSIENLNERSKGVRQQKLPFLTAIEKKHQIEDISQPFFESESYILKRTFSINFTQNEDIYAILEELRSNPDVEYAEPAPLFRTMSAPNDTYYNNILNNNGTSVNSSWHLNLINAAQAWGITTGNSAIKVAVIDNAIWANHPDLVNKVVLQKDLADDDDDTTPPTFNTSWSHGTHTSGLVAAQTNNGLGVASIGYNISLIAIKATKDQSSSPTILTEGMKGILWAADNGANIISMSFGTPDPSTTMQNIVNYAYNRGCILIGAAGNDRKDEKNYPAALNHVIAVASCDESNQKSGFSNYGDWVDVLSPGGSSIASSSFSILSTICGNSNVSAYGVENNYGIMNGTSMSTPIVAGLCGLMFSVNPNLTPEKLTDILKSTCDNVDNVNSSYIGKIGAGRINAYNAVLGAQSSNTTLTANFKADYTSTYPGGEINFFDLSVGTPTSWSWEFEGGNPATSNQQNPTVRYPNSGNFQVKLTVTDASSNTNIETKTSFIIVKGGGTSNWISQNTNIPNLYRGVLDTYIVDPNTAWILTYDGIEEENTGQGSKDFAITTDGGNTWVPGTINIGKEYLPASISATSATKAWVAAYMSDDSRGGIFNTTNGGATWTHQTTAAFGNASSFTNFIYMFNENDGFCQGDPVNGRFEIYVTQNGGTTWTLVPDSNNPVVQTGEASLVRCVSGYGNNAWFGTSKGRVFKTTDKGQSWQVYTTGASYISTISFADANNGVILCARSPWKMQKTADGGATWQDISLSAGTFTSVSAVPRTPGMLVGVRESEINPQTQLSAYSLNYGDSWVKIDQEVQYTDLKMFNSNCGWAGSFNGEQGGGIYKWPGVVPYFTSSPVLSVTGENVYTYNITTASLAGMNVVITANNKPAWLTLTDNGNGTALLTGTAPNVVVSEDFSVSLRVKDNNDTKYSTQNYTLAVTPSSYVDVKPVIADDIKIYPNPSADIIYISNWEGSRYDITDISGKIVMQGNNPDAATEKSINISSLPKGCFFIKLYGNDNTCKIQKIIKS